MPRKPVPATDALLPLDFPTAGLNLSTEFELQPPRTTPAGVNVRSYEPGQDRVRGGSRSGLSKAVPDQVNGTNSIQLIDTVVITDPVAAGGGVLGPGGGGGTGYGGYGGFAPVTHFRRAGADSYWYTNRSGGSGGAAIAFVQQATDDGGGALFGDAAPWTVTLPFDATTGHLLLAAVFSTDAATDHETVSDSQGNLWQQAVASPGIGSAPHSGLRLFYTINNFTGPLTVTFAPNAHGVSIAACVLEYANVDIITPLDGTQAVDDVASAGAVTSGSVNVTGAADLALAVFGPQGGPTAFVPDAGFTVRSTIPSSIIVLDKIGVGAPTSLTGTFDVLTHYWTVGASWRKQ